MDTITVVRLIGLAIVILIFIATVLLMPRIFGGNASTQAETAVAPEPPSARPRPPVPDASVPAGLPADEPAKS